MALDSAQRRGTPPLRSLTCRGGRRWWLTWLTPASVNTRLAINDPAPIRADVGAPENTRVTHSTAESLPVHMPGVVDAYPRDGLIVGAPDARPCCLSRRAHRARDTDAPAALCRTRAPPRRCRHRRARTSGPRQRNGDNPLRHRTTHKSPRSAGVATSGHCCSGDLGKSSSRLAGSPRLTRGRNVRPPSVLT